jgi:phosphoadenosine phosphosulfate reductase
MFLPPQALSADETTLAPQSATFAHEEEARAGETLLSPEPEEKEREAVLLLRNALVHKVYGRTALVSSFGAESAVLLHMVAKIDRAAPVIFLDTGKLFAETLRYRDILARKLGLTDLRVARPDPGRIAKVDPRGDLWQSDPDGCCWQRKVEPLDAALEGFDAWITGRKRFQGATRAELEPVSRGPDQRTTINPLVDWRPGDIAAYFIRNELPPHPLTARGYSSIGCAPCTRPVRPGEDSRAGRWAGRAKTECGIHLPRPNPERLSV